MRIMSNPQATMISLLCGVVFTASAAVAQTTSSDTGTLTKSTGSSVESTQKQAKPFGTQSAQSDDFFQGLSSLPIHPKSDFKPEVGANVPDDMMLHPMPSKAATAMPNVKDHHVVKTDEKTAVIADPKTRKIMSVISSADPTASTSGSDNSDTKAGSTSTDSGSNGSSK